MHLGAPVLCRAKEKATAHFVLRTFLPLGTGKRKVQPFRIPPDAHQGFAFTITWNLLSALSLLFFRRNPVLRQLGRKMSCCFCLGRKISGFLFEVTFQSEDVNVEVFY